MFLAIKVKYLFEICFCFLQKKVFSIEIDRKKHFPVSILSFIALSILFLTTRYLQRGPVEINLSPRYGVHTLLYIRNIGLMQDAFIDLICCSFVLTLFGMSYECNKMLIFSAT